ncbi:MAG: P63C domain-containing protein [Nitrospiraceae bacterium]|nr:P63C domain-containing protein [Nitrospiraceae bacterium]
MENEENNAKEILTFDTEKIKKAAESLSRLGASKGGHARAVSLSAEERKEIARRAIKARWDKARKGDRSSSTATHMGALHIGDLEIPCFVLEDGTRVISGRGMTAAIGMKGRGQGIARITAHKTLNPFLNNELILAIENPLEITGFGLKTFGYEATLLLQVCEAILKARDEGKIKTEQEKRYVYHADILVRAFAKVGIIALVDEATGYQDYRTKQALQEILEKFVAKELQPWVKTFEMDYYKEIFRLNGWPFNPPSVKRPGVIGHWTNDIVYDRLAPNIRQNLHEIAERDEKGRLKHKLFQRLTEGTGHPKLREHLSAVIALMKASKKWEGFKTLLDRALPRFQTTPLLFDDIEDDMEEEKKE